MKSLLNSNLHWIVDSIYFNSFDLVLRCFIDFTIKSECFQDFQFLCGFDRVFDWVSNRSDFQCFQGEVFHFPIKIDFIIDRVDLSSFDPIIVILAIGVC